MSAVASKSLNTTQEVVISVVGKDADGNVTSNMPTPAFDYLDAFFVNYGGAANSSIVSLNPQSDGTCVAKAVAVGSQNVRVWIGGQAMDVTLTVTEVPPTGPAPAVTFEIAISEPRPKTS